jgi:hypothetical protein
MVPRSGFEVTYMDKKKRVPKTRVVLLTDDDFQLLRAGGQGTPT